MYQYFGITFNLLKKDFYMHNSDYLSFHSSPRYISVPSWEKHHDWPKAAGLRHLIFHRHKNGFDKVIKKVGKRVLIDEAAFFNWINEQNKEGG
jgi:hypothetical protein